MTNAPETAADLPVQVRRVLDDFVDAAREAFAEELSSIVLYGSAAEGRRRATSDVNLVVVLKRFDAARADKLADAFALAHAAIRLEAMFVLAGEIATAAEAFAVKFFDIALRHRVLWGDDPMAGLDVPRDALVRRLRQVLFNLGLRLRERYVALAPREERLATVIAEAASPLRTAASALLALEGSPAPSPRHALERMAADLDAARWTPVLAAVTEARQHGSLPPGTGKTTLAALIDLAQALHERAMRLG